MRFLNCGAALLFAVSGTAANAAKYGYCHIDAGSADNRLRYVSALIEVPDEAGSTMLASGGSFREGFLDHVRSRFEPTAQAVTCDSWDALTDAQRLAFELELTGDIIRVRTGWTGGRAEAGNQAARQPARPPKAVAAEATKTTSAPPPKPQWEVEYEAKMAAYERDVAKQKAAVAQFERAQAELARSRQETAERARKAEQDWQRAVAACKAGDYSQCDPQ